MPPIDYEELGLREFDGPVIKDIAQKWSPKIAAHDVNWAARVAAGHARDAGELRDLLQMLGIMDSPRWWVTTMSNHKRPAEDDER